MTEDDRNAAITHWDALLYQWRLEKEQRRMAYELREGQGSLFGNNRKTKDTQPDWKGSIKIGGKTYRIAGWTKQGKGGEPFYSLQVDRQDLPANDESDVDWAMPKEEDEIRF